MRTHYSFNLILYTTFSLFTILFDIFTFDIFILSNVHLLLINTFQIKHIIIFLDYSF
jgi:hypothetical protein